MFFLNKDKRFLKKVEKIKENQYKAYRQLLQNEILEKLSRDERVFKICLPDFVEQNKNIYRKLTDDFLDLGYSIFKTGGMTIIEELRKVKI